MNQNSSAGNENIRFFIPERAMQYFGGDGGALQLIELHLRKWREACFDGQPLCASDIKELYRDFTLYQVDSQKVGDLSSSLMKLQKITREALTNIEAGLQAANLMVNPVAARLELKYFSESDYLTCWAISTKEFDGLGRILDCADSKDWLSILTNMMRNSRCSGDYTAFDKLLTLDKAPIGAIGSGYCDASIVSEEIEQSWLAHLLMKNRDSIAREMGFALSFSIVEALQRFAGGYCPDAGKDVVGFIRKSLVSLDPTERAYAIANLHVALNECSDSWATRNYYQWIAVPSSLGGSVVDVALGIANSTLALDDYQQFRLSFFDYDLSKGTSNESYPDGHGLHSLIRIAVQKSRGEDYDLERVSVFLNLTLKEGAEYYDFESQGNGRGEWENGSYRIIDLGLVYDENLRKAFGLNGSYHDPKSCLENIRAKDASKKTSMDAVIAFGRMLGKQQTIVSLATELSREHRLPIADLIEVMGISKDEVNLDLMLRGQVFADELGV